MNQFRCLLALCTSLFAFSAVGAQEVLTVLQCGKLIDVKAGTISEAMSVVIEGNTIQKVEQGYDSTGKRSKVVDLKTQTCMPGLIDSHTHISGQLSKQSYTERFRLNPADYAFRAAHYAKKTLLAGFTTIRNLGDSNNVTVSLRNAINQGPCPWATGLYCGQILGHNWRPCRPEQRHADGPDWRPWS